MTLRVSQVQRYHFRGVRVCIQALLIIAALCSQKGHRAMAAWSGNNLRDLMAQARELNSRRLVVEDFIARTSAPAAELLDVRPMRSSRGVIMTVAGAEMLLNALVIAKVMRQNLTSSLPIEIVHFDEQVDQKLAAIAKTVSKLELINGSAHPFPEHHWKFKLQGWESKAYALYLSSFSQVVMLDCECQPLYDPERLFSSPAFRENGNTFWPDYFAVGEEDPWKTNAREEAYFLLGLDVPWANNKQWRSTESGQLVIDKVRHRDVLEYVLFINSHSDVMFKHMYGDKDSFQMAFMMAGKSELFYQNPHRLRMALSHVVEPKGKPAYHRSLGNIQSSARGRPFFYHRTMHKFKFSTDLAARSLLPALITESLTSQAMMKDLYHETHIQTLRPKEPFDWVLALHAEGVEIAQNCSQLSLVSKMAIAAEIDSNQMLESQIGTCKDLITRPPETQRIVAVPAHWFGCAIPAGLEAGYSMLAEILQLYSKNYSRLIGLRPDNV